MPLEQLNGIELHYEEYGEGPPLVFLHGGGGTHISWFQQIPYFWDRYRCIVIDHRGFGSSTDPEGEGAARFVDDLEVLLDRLEVGQTALVAQSMGGSTALGYSVRHPERVSALVMCDTVGRFDWPELHARIAELDVAYGGMTAIERAYAASFPTRNPAMALLMRLNVLGGFTRPAALGAASESFQRPAALDIPAGFGKEALAELRVPTMFLVGKEDAFAHPEIVRTVHELVADSEYVEVEGCGHSVYWEDPDTFNTIVGDFLGSHVLSG